MKQYNLSPNDVSTYHGLVAKKAIESWKMYPEPIRSRFDIEDLIQDGLVFVFKFVVPSWRPNAQGQFTTPYLYASLQNFYFNEWFRFKAEKRQHEEKTFSLSPVVNPVSRKINSFAIDPDTVHYIPEWMHQMHTHVVTSMTCVYLEASPSLKESMRRWFFPRHFGPTKVHTHGTRFRQDKKEFLSLAKNHDINKLDCEVLMCSERCQSQIIDNMPENQVLWLKQ